MAKYCILLIFLLTSALLIACGAFFYYQSIPSMTEKTYIVERGESLQHIAKDLHEQGVIQHPMALIVLARITGKANHIQSGEYLFEKNSTLEEILGKMVKGDVIMHHLRIGEGWTFAELAAQITLHPALEKTLDWSSPETIIHQLKLGLHKPEGLFYPDTYYFPRGYTDAAFLTRAYHDMQKLVSAVWEDRAPDLPYKMTYEALIAASIIEKETAVPTEYQEIAGVIVRRLKQHMLLQVDPTVVYGLGADYSQALTHADLAQDTPYNTYLHHGLPPTPIAFPSQAAIYAAMHPANGTTLYFVANGDGSHTFTSTLEAHNKAVAAYRNRE